MNLTPTRVLPLAILALSIAIGPAMGSNRALAAETVKGQLKMPSGLSTQRRFPGYWRIENGTVATKSNPKPHAPIVVIVGKDGDAPPARTYAMTIEGLAPSKRALVVGVGSVVEITNKDKHAHDLYIPGHEDLMPIQRLAPESQRRQKFSSPGAFEIRSQQYPTVAIAIVVVDHPFYAVADPANEFIIENVPDGQAKLKVWTHGRWVHEQDITVSLDTRNLNIVVEPQSAASDAE